MDMELQRDGFQLCNLVIWGLLGLSHSHIYYLHIDKCDGARDHSMCKPLFPHDKYWCFEY